MSESGSEGRAAGSGDEASSSRSSSAATMSRLSSTDQSDGYMKKQLEANDASSRAFLLTEGDREQYKTWVREMPQDGEKSLPPIRLVKYPDLLEKAWGWERLVPFDSFIDMPTFKSYLKQYYLHNSLDYLVAGNQEAEEWPLKHTFAPIERSASSIFNGKGLANVAKFVLETDKKLMCEWRSHVKPLLDMMPYANTLTASNLIQARACSIIHEGGEFSEASAAALLCIIKEDDLIYELLSRGADPNDNFIKQSNEIRLCALSLMDCKGLQSVAVAAAMVGMAKEAKMMCELMKNENELFDSCCLTVPDEFEECNMIRIRTLEFFITIMDESSFSSPVPATASEPDDKVVSASEIDHDSTGNGITGAAEARNSSRNGNDITSAAEAGCPDSERRNPKVQNKITDSTKKKTKLKRKRAKKLAMIIKTSKNQKEPRTVKNNRITTMKPGMMPK